MPFEEEMALCDYLVSYLKSTFLSTSPSTFPHTTHLATHLSKSCDRPFFLSTSWACTNLPFPLVLNLIQARTRRARPRPRTPLPTLRPPSSTAVWCSRPTSTPTTDTHIYIILI